MHVERCNKLKKLRLKKYPAYLPLPTTIVASKPNQTKLILYFSTYPKKFLNKMNSDMNKYNKLTKLSWLYLFNKQTYCNEKYCSLYARKILLSKKYEPDYYYFQSNKVT